MSAGTPSVSQSVLDEWARHIDQTLTAPDGPSVQALLEIATAHEEAPRDALLPLLARQCGTATVQGTWAEWTSVTDREELRLRLKVVAHLDTLDPALNGFILFFFRSSDPELYQAAARALGRHMHDQPELAKFLRGFADRHSVDLDAPIPLTGERSHRRILLASAARRAAGHEQVPVLSTEDPETVLDASPLDLNVALMAARIVLEGESSEQWMSFAFTCIEGLAQRPVASAADPSLLRSCGLLLAALGDRAPTRSVQGWLALLRRIVSPPGDEIDEAFHSRLQQLNRLDELIRTAVRLPVPLQDSLLDQVAGHAGRRLRCFLRYRWLLWAERNGHPLPREHANRPPAPPKDAEVLSVLLEAEIERDAPSSPLGDGSVTARRHSAFGTLLRALGEKTDWLHRPVEQRALIAFATLDFSRYVSQSSTSVEATFERFSFPELRDAPAAQATATAPGRAGTATFRILLRLSDWEGTGTERLIDTSLLHQITDSYVLMMLLPSERESELTDPLADALEHQLRLQLRTHPDFRPEQFLYETSIRAPHPQFYRQLRRLCEGRTYHDTHGREVPVATLVDRVLNDAQQTSPSYSADRPQQGSREDGDAPSPLHPHVRRTLDGIRTEPDLVAGLEDLIGVLDPKSKDPSTGSRGLFGVLTAHGSTTSPLVHRGASGTHPPTYRGIRTELQEHAIALREALDHLQPSTLADAHDARDDALEIEEVLDRVEAHIVPVIGVGEAQMLSLALRHLRRQLHAWTDALASLHVEWRTREEEGDTDVETADRLLRQILDREPGPLRARLVSLLGQTLVPQHESETSTDLDRAAGWSHEHALLRWAVAQEQSARLSLPERTEWLATFTAQWEALLDEAMEAGHEARVRSLTADGAFEVLRARPAATDALERAQDWFLDRYHLPAACELTATLRSASPLGSLVRTAGTFLAHFSRVWLALLLGAILMLDFGDAWTAMAAEGNVLSVAITFVVGILGTLGYLFVDLRRKVQRAPGEDRWRARRSRWGRLLSFLGVCLGMTVGLTSTLWFLLAGTGAVVEGAGAVLHVVVWTGFALFVGIFFGLLAEAT